MCWCFALWPIGLRLSHCQNHAQNGVFALPASAVRTPQLFPLTVAIIRTREAPKECESCQTTRIAESSQVYMSKNRSLSSFESSLLSKVSGRRLHDPPLFLPFVESVHSRSTQLFRLAAQPHRFSH